MTLVTRSNQTDLVRDAHASEPRGEQDVQQAQVPRRLATGGNRSVPHQEPVQPAGGAAGAV